jgi:virulence-associated protein VagC
MIAIAKVFNNGDRQTIRFPKGFRFDVDEVCINRLGSAVLLFEKKTAWDLMGQAIGQVDKDFMVERSQPEHADRRKSLAKRKAKRS